ncbi:MAG: beta-lactamase family protein [Chloroflexota bacterium]|nr:beta-lactamase family protein [Chloroflexota bacterium]
MSGGRSQEPATIEATVRAAVEATRGRFGVPGIVVLFARGAAPPAEIVAGADAAGEPLRADTLFPVASITKLATALAVLRLVDRGEVALDDPLARHLPDAAAAVDGVTVRKLLAHTGGVPLDLPKGLAPYAEGLDWRGLAAACLRAPLEAPPDTRVQYSNVGYGLLALVVERRTGEDFADALDALVLGPLGIDGYLGVEPTRAPATLTGVRGRHAGTRIEPFNSAFWRSLALPWAGLLTDAAGALALVRAFRGVPAEFLRPETRAEATRNQAGDLAGGMAPPLMWRHSPWGLGPELRGTKTPHWAPPEAGPDSFGHAGASGCLAWADPSADVAWAMLGARTADNGWAIRGGPPIGAAVLAARGAGGVGRGA